MLQERSERQAERVGVLLACAAFGIKPRTYRHRRAQARTALVGGVVNCAAASASPAASDATTSAAAGSDATDAAGAAGGVAGTAAVTSVKRVKVRNPHPASLTAGERLLILDTLCSEAYYDKPPAQVFNALLDDGVYLCSVRQMYRLLADHGLSNERRRGGHAKRGLHPEPVVRASKPNEAWSWDITKLKGPRSGALYYLYTIIDLYSRYVVGWSVHDSESTALATSLIRASAKREGVNPGQLTLHADRGSPMTARGMIELLDGLGIRWSHSRPRVSNDNPYSEAHFKTVKYHPAYPDRFGSLQDARVWCREFFDWYNHQHYHSGIAYLHPASLHHGAHEPIIDARQRTLDDARAANPHRFH